MMFRRESGHFWLNFSCFVLVQNSKHSNLKFFFMKWNKTVYLKFCYRNYVGISDLFEIIKNSREIPSQILRSNRSGTSRIIYHGVVGESKAHSY
jgi:hypothetical protein